MPGHFHGLKSVSRLKRQSAARQAVTRRQAVFSAGQTVHRPFARRAAKISGFVGRVSIMKRPVKLALRISQARQGPATLRLAMAVL